MKCAQAILFGLMVFAVVAAGPEFTSNSAKQAAVQYGNDTNKSRDAYVASLKRAMQISARDNNPDEVSRIAAEIKRINDLGKLEEESGPSGMQSFETSSLVDTEVRFMFEGGSRRILLKKNGELEPQQFNEFYWRVTDKGHLQFWHDDKNHPQDWPGYFVSGGHAYAGMIFDDSTLSPHVLVFSKPPTTR